MRIPMRTGVGGVTAALVLALMPAAAGAAPNPSVTSAEQLESAMDQASTRRGGTTITIGGDIELDSPLVFDGTGRLTLRGPGSLIGTDPDQDVLVVTTDRRVTIEDLTVTGGRRGIVVVAPQGADRRVRVDLHDVVVSDTGYHGVQVIDGLVDLDASGGGTGQVPADEDLPTEALVESQVVGGSEATLVVRTDNLTVVESGRAALDQDGLRVDERGGGDIVARLDDSSFTANGADGVELDEAGDGRVVLRMTGSTVEANGDENVQATEEDAGDLLVRLDDSITSGSADGSGVLLEEFGDGTMRGRVRGTASIANAGSGIELLSLDISGDEADELDDAGEALPRDGEVGRVRVQDALLEGNVGGPVTTFGVRVRGDLRLDAFPPAPPPPPEPDYTLTVLHINDGESDLLGDEGTDAGSISRFGELLEDRRSATNGGRDRGAVAITAGDNFLAGPELTASFAKGVPYYDSIALEKLDFDAFAIGNHEFDFGPEVLADFIRGTDSDECNDPFISANLDFSAEPALQQLVDENCIDSSTITIRDGRRIGVIGLTTPELREVSSPGDTEILTNLAELANAEAAALAADGADIVLLASHLQDIDNEVALVPQLTGIDAVIGGGGGEALAAPLTATDADGNTVPVVTVPGDYQDLGELTLGFTDDGELLDFSWALLPVTGDLQQDQFLLREVEEPVAEFLSELDQTVITTSEVGLNGVENDARTRETNVGNLLADSFVDVAEARAAEFGVTLGGPLVGLQNGGGIRNDAVIPPGEVTLLDTFDIAPFSNFVAVLPDVAPADLVTAVEHGLEGLPDTAGSFAQWSNLVVEYDGDAAPGSRVVNLTVAGTPYVLDGALQGGLEPVDIATIDFLAAGNDGYDVFETYGFTRLGTSYQQALADLVATADLSAGSVEYGERGDVAARTRIIPVAVAP